MERAGEDQFLILVIITSLNNCLSGCHLTLMNWSEYGIHHPDEKCHSTNTDFLWSLMTIKNHPDDVLSSDDGSRMRLRGMIKVIFLSSTKLLATNNSKAVRKSGTSLILETKRHHVSFWRTTAYQGTASKLATISGLRNKSIYFWYVGHGTDILSPSIPSNRFTI